MSGVLEADMVLTSDAAHELLELRELRTNRAIGAKVRRSSKLRRRMLVMSIAVLAVLASSLTVSHLGNTGTLSASVTGTTPSYVFMAGNNTTLPTQMTSLKYTPSAGINGSHVLTSVVNPGWSPSAQSAGSVTTAGDIAAIDGSVASNGLAVSLYVTNLAALQSDYSSFAFPLNIYMATPGSCTTSCIWTQDAAVIASAPTYLTSTTGFIEFNLPAGSFYDITFDTGGSLFCTATTVSATAALAPAFFVTAQPY
jgi:hypothetical protein